MAASLFLGSVEEADDPRPPPRKFRNLGSDVRHSPRVANAGVPLESLLEQDCLPVSLPPVADLAGRVRRQVTLYAQEGARVVNVPLGKFGDGDAGGKDPLQRPGEVALEGGHFVLGEPQVVLVLDG